MHVHQYLFRILKRRFNNIILQTCRVVALMQLLKESKEIFSAGLTAHRVEQLRLIQTGLMDEVVEYGEA